MSLSELAVWLLTRSAGKAIFLVGGFGSSHYLKACVEKEHPKIQVLQPDDAWAAIVKYGVLPPYLEIGLLTVVI